MIHGFVVVLTTSTHPPSYSSTQRRLTERRAKALLVVRVFLTRPPQHTHTPLLFPIDATVTV